MAYERVTMTVEGRVSRHDDERDRRDDDAWEAFKGDVGILQRAHRYRHLFDEPEEGEHG